MPGVRVKQAKPANRKLTPHKALNEGIPLPRYIGHGNVYDAAKARIAWLYDEFDGQVAVSNSGGKDSTVCVELAVAVARERGALPVKVVWLDQECEYQSTVDYQRWMNQRPEIDFRWYQIPFRLFNATNHDDPWLRVWGENEEWVRDKEPDSIHENTFTDKHGVQVDRFKDVLAEINKRTGGAIITGMRAEESPHRRAMLTSAPMYKWVTWCSEGYYGPYYPEPDSPINFENRTRNGTPGLPPDSPGPLYWMFHPIFDWYYQDVWKAINNNDWRYNIMYDVQFRYGVDIRSMRVSNYHHETALKSLTYLQEAEPETWEAATRRLAGINTVGHWSISRNEARTLPYMFTSWQEYLFHLIDNLVTHHEHRETYRKRYASVRRYDIPDEEVARAMVRSVINGDLYGTTIESWVSARRKSRSLEINNG